MELDAKAQELFCKYYSIPIKVFGTKAFDDRIELYDHLMGTKEKLEIFREEIKGEVNAETYSTNMNKNIDNLIEAIRISNGFADFDKSSINQIKIQHPIKSNKTYTMDNAGKTLLSIDMIEANFQSLRTYRSDIFGTAKNWSEFVEEFTSSKVARSSKYIRLKVFGKLESEKIMYYSRYLMDRMISEVLERKVLSGILSNSVLSDGIMSVTNDEVILDISDLSLGAQLDVTLKVQEMINDPTKNKIPMRVEAFKLYPIMEVLGPKQRKNIGYFKKIISSGGKGELKLKAADNNMIPFILRRLYGQEPFETDSHFLADGRLAKYESIPEIECDLF